MASKPSSNPLGPSPRLILLNKPFGVLCQFSADGSGKPTLKDYVDVASVYPAGRLDTDSEGLLALTDYGPLQARIAQPEKKLPKTYWVQVEGSISAEALERLARGVSLKDGVTAPAIARALPTPTLWEREPPIRFRKNIPTSWLELTISEGRNRQVRRMTAAVGFPTLRLIRAKIGPFSLGDMLPGQWREIPPDVIAAAFGPLPAPRRRPPSGARIPRTSPKGRPRRHGHGAPRRKP